MFLQPFFERLPPVLEGLPDRRELLLQRFGDIGHGHDGGGLPVGHSSALSGLTHFRRGGPLAADRSHAAARTARAFPFCSRIAALLTLFRFAFMHDTYSRRQAVARTQRCPARLRGNGVKCGAQNQDGQRRRSDGRRLPAEHFLLQAKTANFFRPAVDLLCRQREHHGDHKRHQIKQHSPVGPVVGGSEDRHHQRRQQAEV